MSNSKFKKLTLGIKNDNEVTLEISSNIVDDSSDEDNFLHKLSLSNAQSLLKLWGFVKLFQIVHQLI